MKNLFYSGRLLFLDMVSTVFFLVLYVVTRNLPLAVGLGICLGVTQIGWEIARRKSVDTMQWVSLVTVVASGTATLISHDVRFMMVKLSVVYLLVGTAMCKPGWMDRYLPSIAKELTPDLAIVFGFVWAGLMFFSGLLNMALALTCTFAVWASVISIYGIASKLGLFMITFGTMRWVGGRRLRARQTQLANAGESISTKQDLAPQIQATFSSPSTSPFQSATD